MRNIYLLLIIFSIIGSRAQQIEWIDSISYSGEQTVSKIALDNNGNIYVAGFYGGYRTVSHGTFIHKYSPNGNLLWKDKTYAKGDGPQSAGLATDSEGNVYTALWNSGQSNTIQIGNTVYPGGINGFLIKYDSSGQIQWVQVLQQTIVSDISTNSHQHIFLACNNTIEEFDPSGNLVSNLPFCSNWMLQVDPNDAVYATCSYIQKIFAGSLQWTYPMSGNYAFTPDKFNNCYVTTLGNPDCTSSILKINSGQLIWSYTVPYWGGKGIYMNSYQKLFVLGASGNGTPEQQILDEFDDEGTLNWRYLIPNSSDQRNTQVIEKDGNIYIGGQDKYKSFVYLMKIKVPMRQLPFMKIQSIPAASLYTLTPQAAFSISAMKEKQTKRQN